MAYEVVKLKEKRVVGIKVATTMEKAARDCPALWMTFGPRMRKELVPLDILNPSGESYGVSVMTSKTGFDYWTAVEVGWCAGGENFAARHGNDNMACWRLCSYTG